MPDFFEQPILNSPYEYPGRHWEHDETGQPTQRIVESRRVASFITPVPKPKKQKVSAQKAMVFDEGTGLSSEAQQYDPTGTINEIRSHVDAWRSLPNPNQWGSDTRDGPLARSLAAPRVQLPAALLLPGVSRRDGDLAH